MSKEFRAAGEFYGHLLAALPLSDLIMWHERRGFVYQWRIKINNRDLVAEHLVTSFELTQSRFIGEFARTVAARWRQKVEESL